MNRLMSFDNTFPHGFMICELSKYGFFYTGFSDHVKCAFCTVIIFNWEPADKPLTEHRKHAPSCPFLRGEPVGNVPFSVYQPIYQVVSNLTSNNHPGYDETD